MKRMFLYEIMDDIAEAEDLKERFTFFLDNAKGFKDLIDIIYNKDYVYELDKSLYEIKSRSTRDNGGFATAWLDVVKVMKSKLITVTGLSPRFPDYYQKACRACNKKDVEILNYALVHRNLPGFQGARKKILLSIIDEYNGVSDGETV